MEVKRLVLLVAIGLVIGGGAFAAVLLIGPGSEADDDDAPIKTMPPEVPAPALTPVDPELLNAPAPQWPRALPFLDMGKPAVAQVGALREGRQATEVTFMPDGKHLLAIDGNDMTLRLWDWNAGKVVSSASHHSGLVSCAVAPDGSGAWTSDGLGTLHWWPLSDGAFGARSELGTDLGSPLHVAVSPNGRLLACASYARTLALWDTAEHSKLVQITTDEPLRRCVFSPDGKRLIACTNTNQLLEYHLATGLGRKVQILPVKPDIDLMCAAFSPDGKRFSTGHTQPWVTIWEGDSLTYKHWLACPEQAICDVAYSRDNALIALALGGLGIHLWKPDVAAEEGSVAVLTGHTKFIHTLAFSPDGRILASGDDGGTILLWSSSD